MITARAAHVKSLDKSKKAIAAEVVSDCLIGPGDMAMVYISPDPFYGAFEEELDLRKFDFAKHCTAGLCFVEKDQRLLLASMDPSTPGARISWWRTRICGVWLIEIDGTCIFTITDAQDVFRRLATANALGCTLPFLHSKVTPDISTTSLPIMSKSIFSKFTHDQLNNWVYLLKDGLWVLRTRKYNILELGDVRQYVTRVMQLMRGKLLHQDDWSDWE